MESVSESDDKLRLSGDQVGGDKILSGNVAGSVAAIGAGANVIYNKVERAMSQVESLEQFEEFENKRLAEALTDYVHRLERQASQAKEDPGDGNPYKALLEFDIQDAALFYGRTIAIRELLTHTKRDQLTVLHAGSGLGKTSLLKAGIMPRLLADGHLPLYLRPYQTPVHLAVKRALLVDVEDIPQLARLSLHDFLRRVTGLISGGQLVVIIDQFEELFTIQNEQARNEFIDQLSTCLDDDLLPVRWILSLRDEWFGQLGTFRPHIRNPYANEFMLRPLTRAEASLVISQPAARRQITYEPALVERLMDDMGREEIAPPHLQLVCSMLFDSLGEQTVITESMYEEAGETKGILRGYLYRVLSRDMPKEMREPAHRLLEALVTSEKRRALRTREDLTAELSAWGYPASMVDQVLNQLTDSRLLRIEEFMLDKVHSVAGYELAHDYLLEEIEITPELQARKAAQELLTQKLPYYKRERLLLSPQELAIILPQRKWLILTEDAAALLQESQAAATRQRRMFRAGIVIVTLLLMSAIALIAIQQNIAKEQYETIASTAVAAQSLAEREANAALDAKKNAETLATTSFSRKLASDAQLAESLGDPISVYKFSTESFQVEDNVESRSALYTASSIPLPERIISLPPQEVDIFFSANFDPKSNRLVTACSDNAARVWDLVSGKELFKLQGHTKAVMYASYSPDGKQIVTSSQDGSVNIWDAQNGNMILSIPAHQGTVFSAIFSPDGSRIVTAGNDMTAAIWDAKDGKELLRLKGHTGYVRFANFSPDGQRVVTAGRDGTARIWNARTGKPIMTLKGHKAPIRSVAFSPDGKQIITASEDRTSRVWDAKTGETLLFLVPHNSGVASANFSPDGRFIITAGLDGLNRLWDSSNGALIAIFPGHTDSVNWANFSPDGKWIVSASNDSSVWLRQALRISGSNSFIGHHGGVTSINFNQGGTRFVTSSTDTTARVWDVQSGKELFPLQGHTREVRFATYSPDGKQIATVGADKTVRLWNALDGSELKQFQVDALSVNFSPDGMLLVTSGRDDYLVRLWDIQTSAEIPPALEGHTDEVNYAVFSPDGTLIATAGGSHDGTVRLWDASTHKLLKTWQILSEDEVNSVRFSPDGKRLAVAADAGFAEIWDVDQGNLIRRLVGHQTDVTSAAFSPDGRLLATASEDHTLRIWDTQTAQSLALLRGHIDEVNWIAFSPDGKWIYSASNDRTVRTWPVYFDDLYELIQSELMRLKTHS